MLLSYCALPFSGAQDPPSLTFLLCNVFSPSQFFFFFFFFEERPLNHRKLSLLLQAPATWPWEPRTLVSAQTISKRKPFHEAPSSPTGFSSCPVCRKGGYKVLGASTPLSVYVCDVERRMILNPGNWNPFLLYLAYTTTHRGFCYKGLFPQGGKKKVSPAVDAFGKRCNTCGPSISWKSLSMKPLPPQLAFLRAPYVVRVATRSWEHRHLCLSMCVMWRGE
ncbi:uncharacterized protein LOC127542973 isoform X3 [Antechinus flavipes]|uniref:uncharacterized protein LOC127542973 isoform X3 n=1 Tax=Antechinus flavipes TaxID=38775 RepID=UPI002235DD8B|nr:uncharacterized protein LOC127542973 isoform X3 [Antechinus flavipes]